jgi:hypothetical protein
MGPSTKIWRFIDKLEAISWGAASQRSVQLKTSFQSAAMSSGVAAFFVIENQLD